MKRRSALIILITLIVAVRVSYFFAQPDLSSDNILQMAMAQNFSEGQGLSFKYWDTQKGIYYTTNIQSPPLYPLMISLVSIISGNSLLSSFILQIAVLLVLVVIWKKIFNLFIFFISAGAYFYFIFLLIISTSILNNINTILVFALLLLSFSLYFTFAYLFDDKLKKTNLVFSALFSALLFWTHYSYFFVSFYPAFVLFVMFYLTKNKHYFYGSFKSFVISFIVVSGVLIYNYLTTGFINYMDNPDIWDAGFFPEHLLLTDPFIVNSFFKTSYLFDYLFSEHQHILVSLSLQLLSLIIFAVIIILFLRLRKNKRFQFDKTSQLFVPFFTIMVLMLSFLLYFTLRYHEIPSPNWTHIGDPRYMSAVYLSIIAIAVMLVFIKADIVEKKVVNAIKLAIVFLIFINLAINIYITADHWGKYSFAKNTYEVPNKDLTELYDNIKLEKSKGSVPVFIDNDLTVRSVRISQYAGAAVIGSDEIFGIEDFPANMVFFFFLPIAEQYREEDFQILDWGKNFNLNDAGKVYNNLTLYKVEK